MCAVYIHTVGHIIGDIHAYTIIHKESGQNTGIIHICNNIPRVALIHMAPIQYVELSIKDRYAHGICGGYRHIVLNGRIAACIIHVYGRTFQDIYQIIHRSHVQTIFWVLK